jgi:hypothetical protein
MFLKKLYVRIEIEEIGGDPTISSKKFSAP